MKIVRQLPLSGRSQLFSVDVNSAEGKTFEIQEFDAVEVLDGRLACPGGQISVEGAVHAPAIRPYVERESLRDAIELAGGPTEKGEDGKAFVEYPSGFSKRVHRVALLFHSSPDVVSGAIITVPEKPESKTTAGEMWTRVFQSTAALTSLVVAIVAVRRL